MAQLSSFFTAIDDHSIPILALLVVWATLTSGTAWLLTWLWRRASSGVRYCTWQFAFLCLLVLPCTLLVLPGIPLGFTLESARQALSASDEVPAGAQAASSRAAIDVAPPSESENFSARRESASQQPFVERQSPFTEQARRRDVVERVDRAQEPIIAATTSRARASLRMNWSMALSVVWSGGVLAQLGWLLWCVRRALRIVRGAEQLHDARLLSILAQLETPLALSQRARLLTSSELRVPVVVGIRRATILLPAACVDWSAEKLRIVLSHELAHVERRDIFWQLAARTAAALYWFHPLVWLGVRRMRQERERACDDRVLSSGVQALDYASTLVEVAAELAGRPAPLVGGIGMAEQLPLEDRVRSILDRSLPRHAASVRLRRLLLAATACFALTLGVVRPFSPLPDKLAQAVDVKEATEQPADAPTAAPPPAAETKTDAQPPVFEKRQFAETKGSMRIRVVGPDGQPTGGAEIHASIWTDEKGFKATRDYTCDEQGQTEIELPRTLTLLRIWASKDGFVPLIVQWQPQEEPDGYLIPDEFTFHQQVGTEVGGVVVNEENEPIEGVEIEAVYRGGGAENPASGRAESLVRDKSRTDADGRWVLGGVPPGDDVDVRVQVRHPDYISDRNWDRSQGQRYVTAAALRAKSATTIMRRGMRITGTITTPNGEPVADAVVIWGDRPYFESGSQETKTDAKGAYHVAALPPGPIALTVVAKGWMPERRSVTVAAEMAPVDFELRPGKTLSLRVVDDSGAPVPLVGVSIYQWRGAESLYNVVHSNVVSTRIPRMTDGRGIFEWTWAPEDEVTYRFGKEGYAELEVPFTADGSQQTLVLHKPLRFAGSVVDANSGLPIKEFAAVPMIHFRADFPSLERQEVESCVDGRFDVQRNRGDVEHSLQVEAPGYQTVLVGPYKMGQVVPELRLSMKPAERFVGRVRDEAGQAVANARVYVGSYSEHLYLSDLDPRGDGGRSSNYWVATDEQGRFEIAHQLERYCLVVVSDDGYGEADRAVGEMPGEITLRRWAKISGELVQSSQGVRAWQARLEPLREEGGDAPRGSFRLSGVTEEDGTFVFERVPPVPCRVTGDIHWSVEGPLSSARSVPLTPAPGEEITVSLGGGGAEVTGELVLDPPAADFDYHFGLNYLVARRAGIEPPPAIASRGFDWRSGWSDAWSSSSEGLNFLNTLHHYYVKPDPDGRFRISGVEPGEYDLAFRLYGSTEGCLVHPVGLMVQRVTVSEGQTALDLGKIRVPALSGLKVGDSAPDFDFTDLDGQQRSLADARGKYVLIDFWATWCGPCIGGLAEVEALRRRYGTEFGLTVVGANLDADRERAVDFLRKKDLAWQHALLGDWSSTEVPKRFGISSLPTYVLVDGEGRVLAHESSLATITAILEERAASESKR